MMRIEHETSFGRGARTPVGPDRRGEPDTQLPHDFAAWYNDHRGTVYRYIRFRVATRETAEDVTSEVFMKALRAIDRYDPGRAAPRTWLLRIARNAVTDHLRSLRRRGSLHVSLDRSTPPTPSPQQKTSLHQRVRACYGVAGGHS